MEITFDVIASALGHNPETIKSKFVELDGETEKPLTGDALNTAIQGWLKEETTRFYSEGEKRGKRERMAEFEKAVREKYGVEAKQQGEALIDAIVSAKTSELEQLRQELAEMKAKPAGKKLEEIDPEQAKSFIANHPFFKEEVQKLTSQIQEKESAFEQFKQQMEQEQTAQMVTAFASDWLETDYKPIYPEIPEIAQNLKRLFLQDVLSAAKWVKDENGKPVAFDPKTNEQVVNPANYLKLTPADFLALRAKNFFQPHPVDPSKGAPGKASGQGGDGLNIPDWRKFGNKDEIITEILNEKDPDKQAKLFESAKPHL